MKVGVSNREFSDLKGQVEDAVGFLKENDHELSGSEIFPAWSEWI